MPKLLLFILPLLLLFRPINPADYPERIDYGTLTAEERAVFDDILAAAAAGVPVVRCRQHVNQDKLRTHLGLHYGRIDGCGRLFVVSGDALLLNLEAFAEFEQHREKVNAMADAALAQLHHGSDRCKLAQIARYIAANFAYTTGEFTCTDYTVLLYKIASRLGIKTYVCFGYAAGNLHTWNMVELHGRRYFYDLTWFDAAPRKYQYLHSPAAWGRSFALGDAWAPLQ